MYKGSLRLSFLHGKRRRMGRRQCQKMCRKMRLMLAKRAGSPISGNKIRGLHRPSAEIGLSVPILLPFFFGNENFDNILVSLSHPPLSLPTFLQESPRRNPVLMTDDASTGLQTERNRRSGENRTPAHKGSGRFRIKQIIYTTERRKERPGAPFSSVFFRLPWQPASRPAYL